jgi:hypothetical protein
MEAQTHTHTHTPTHRDTCTCIRTDTLTQLFIGFFSILVFDSLHHLQRALGLLNCTELDSPTTYRSDKTCDTSAAAIFKPTPMLDNKSSG